MWGCITVTKCLCMQTCTNVHQKKTYWAIKKTLFCLSLLQQMLSAIKKAVSQRILQKLSLSLCRSSSWRCLVRSGPAHSAPRSAFHCQHQSHKDYGCDSCSLAQSFGFTPAEIRALQNSQHSNSFIAVSAVRGIFSPKRYDRVTAGHKGVNKYISCIWSLWEQKSSPSVPYLMPFFPSLWST